MFATLMLFTLHFKGAAILAGVSLIAGGYLSHRYSSYVEKKASAAISKADAAVDGVAKKV